MSKTQTPAAVSSPPVNRLRTGLSLPCLHALAVAACVFSSGCAAPLPKSAGAFTRLAPNLFLWTDTCNVYVVRDGDSALLIDLGDGTILDRLEEIGVREVEWVLFTHHHREQCQGAARLKARCTKFAAPAAERDLFEQPAEFRKMNVALEDQFTIHGIQLCSTPG